MIFITLVVQGLSLPLLIKWLKIEKKENPDMEAKKLQLSLLQSTILFIEHDYSEMEESIKKKLIKKYGDEIQLLTEEISADIQDKTEESPLSARNSAMQQALIDIKQFQRAWLLQLHKSGQSSDLAIREVERDIDIDELKLNQTLPKTE